MTSDMVEWFFGGAWLFAIFFLWLIYFGGMEGDQSVQVWPSVSMRDAALIGVIFAIAFMVVMSWVQFQRRVSQYAAVTDFVLPTTTDKKNE